MSSPEQCLDELSWTVCLNNCSDILNCLLWWVMVCHNYVSGWVMAYRVEFSCDVDMMMSHESCQIEKDKHALMVYWWVFELSWHVFEHHVDLVFLIMLRRPCLLNSTLIGLVAFAFGIIYNTWNQLYGRLSYQPGWVHKIVVFWMENLEYGSNREEK